jgi:hypothetical protein
MISDAGKMFETHQEDIKIQPKPESTAYRNPEIFPPYLLSTVIIVKMKIIFSKVKIFFEKSKGV